MSNTPWRAWLAAAASLGVQPHLFWRLSAREWRALADAHGAPALGRTQFNALAARFPDKQHG